MANIEESKITAKELIVKYGKTIALDSFDAKIPKGISGLLGPNGAGKSTFIKSILGLIEPVSGKIKIDGLKDNLSPIERRDIIGYMPEHNCLIEDMKGFELVSYMSRLSGLPRGDAVERAHASLDFVELGEERYRKISSYSTGMKQRVKLAQAITHDPDIFLLDEPTTGMDPDGKEDMLDLIEKIGELDKTIMISSHILHEVEQVSDYVVIIHQGKAVKCDFMDNIMSADDGRYKLKLRGSEENIQNFIEELSSVSEVIRTVEEKKQVTVVVKNLKKTDKVFELAEKEKAQLRYMRPDLLTLEDFFLDSFSGGERGGY
ncbi:MAG: ABC transporter ATP-binding protein [Candidatus Saliniplasma sp.]